MEKKKLLTGVPNYWQWKFTNDNGKEVLTGCGPTAALMLLAFYDRRLGYKNLIGSEYESDNTPTGLIKTLRNKMKTVTVGSDNYGLTEPNLFMIGLKSYIKDKGYDVVIHEMHTLLGGSSMDEIFDKSQELINNDVPHIILFDYNPTEKSEQNEFLFKFPSHYSLVVGYSTTNEKNLFINTGFGYPFYVLDFSDSNIKPVRIFWLEMESTADGNKDGHQIGPTGTRYDDDGMKDWYSIVKSGDSFLAQINVDSKDGKKALPLATRTKHPVPEDAEPHISVSWWS